MHHPLLISVSAFAKERENKMNYRTLKNHLQFLVLQKQTKDHSYGTISSVSQDASGEMKQQPPKEADASQEERFLHTQLIGWLDVGPDRSL